MTADQAFAIFKNKLDDGNVSEEQITAAIEKYLSNHPEYKTQSVYDVAKEGGYSGPEETFPQAFAAMLQVANGNEVRY